MLVLALACASRTRPHPHAADPDLARWEARAAAVTLVRDDHGIAHVHGDTDADAVFGMVYAQAEDDFPRIEANWLTALGRTAEAEGEAALTADLRARLFVDPDQLRAEYDGSPAELRALMDAWADGLDFWLRRHPEVHPRAIDRFEPWMALAFTEGSIGGDIEQISLRELGELYGTSHAAPGAPSGDGPRVDGGSNGIAIAPSRTASGRALLLINPHTTFYFRSELQVASDEGLDVYGAATWGQPFVYQGFNERLGWMHTSSGVDDIDEYLETVTRGASGFTYRVGAEERPVQVVPITLKYRTDHGLASRTIDTWRTEHGPIVRAIDGRWVAVRLLHDPVPSLTESFGRTKARDLREFRDSLELHTNSSNNTVYADADGNIAYFHANFVPRRDPRFDWTAPVDGADPATAWGDALPFDERPEVVDPSTGWVFNTNDAPWTAAGPASPSAADFPPYVDRFGENPRGVHARQLLDRAAPFTLDDLVALAFDPYLPAFDELRPGLLAAWERLPGNQPLRSKLAEPVATLREWDLRWSATSIATTVAVCWAEALWDEVGADDHGYRALAGASDDQRLQALATAVDRLERDFGTWRVAWGEVNRFQRLPSGGFDDQAPSSPVPFTSGRWGSLAAFDVRRGEGTRKRYGTSGNTFVAAVEFGDRVRARAVTAGGESGDPGSPHFADQIERYAGGDLRPVYFWPDELEGHVERRYHPGE